MVTAIALATLHAEHATGALAAALALKGAGIGVGRGVFLLQPLQFAKKLVLGHHALRLASSSCHSAQALTTFLLLA
jgi:hypothetical protein